MVYQLPPVKPIVVINGVLSANELPRIYVGRTWDATGPVDTNSYLPNAMVQLLENGRLAAIMTYTSKGIFTTNYKPKAGNSYKINVADAKTGSAETASVQVPQPVIFTSVDVDSARTGTANNFGGDEVRYLRIELADTPSAKDILGFIVSPCGSKGYIYSNLFPAEATGSLRNENNDCIARTGLYDQGRNLLGTNYIISGNLPCESNRSILLYFGSCFAPKQRLLTLATTIGSEGSQEGKATTLFMQIMRVSPEYYEYTKTMMTIEDINNAFVEPARTYSNVIGGFGVLASVNAQQLTLPIR